jgi:hypothetical protein
MAPSYLPYTRRALNNLGTAVLGGTALGRLEATRAAQQA